MKICCNCQSCGRQIYLASNAKSRRQLSNTWGIVFNINCRVCTSSNAVHVSRVYAETTRGHTPYSAGGGGMLIGMIGGPLGMIIGGLFGAVGGSISRSQDIDNVDSFNNSSF